jgi:hypothetical protein
VAELALDPKVSAEECRREFGDQLLGRIGLGAEAVLEVPVEPLLGRRPMTIMPISA